MTDSVLAKHRHQKYITTTDKVVIAAAIYTSSPVFSPYGRLGMLL